MNAKRFFYVSAGILMLVIAYSIRASRAQGQTTPPRAVAITAFSQYNELSGSMYNLAVVAENGDVYWKSTRPNGIETNPAPWQFVGNVFATGVQVQGKSWGAVKQSFKK